MLNGTKISTSRDLFAGSSATSLDSADKPRNVEVKSLFVLLFLFISRLIANYFIPLNDTTEARYGEIARKMLETGNWVTLLHDYTLPFWAKPPLSTWLTALSMQLFGVNEFAARLPSLFLSLGILWLIWDVSKKHSGPAAARVSVLVLASTLFFFLDAGAVMTDPSLLFCITLASVSFWQALVYKNKGYSYLFFVGLGLGLLAKGPLILVLVGMPLFFWILVHRLWGRVWQSLPWIKGSILLCLIALPWYVAAESRTPGFLYYFIVGEHLHRFLIPGWTGDKYGIAHHAPKGIIWLYALVGLFPWSLVAMKWLFQHGKQLPSLLQDKEGWISYWGFFLFIPLSFFTFSSNLIYPYVFPVLPAFAVFFTTVGTAFYPSFTNSLRILWSATLSGVASLLLTLVFVIQPNWVEKTHKPIVEAWIQQHPKAGSSLMYWDKKTDFSADFYSAGKAQATQDLSLLRLWSANPLDHYLVISPESLPTLPKAWSSQWTLVKTIPYAGKKVLLFHLNQLNLS